MVTPLSVGGGLRGAVLPPQAALCGTGRFRWCHGALGWWGFARFATWGRRRRRRRWWWGLPRDISCPRFGRWGRFNGLVGLLLRLRNWLRNWLLSWELSWELRLNNGWLLHHDWFRRGWLLFIFRARRTTTSSLYWGLLRGGHGNWFAGWD